MDFISIMGQVSELELQRVQLTIKNNELKQRIDFLKSIKTDPQTVANLEAALEASRDHVAEIIEMIASVRDDIAQV